MPVIAIFRDDDFQPMPEFGPEDVAMALQIAGQAYRFVTTTEIDHGALDAVEVLVWPVVHGCTDEALLLRLQAFHARGGGLFILGEIPHDGLWYPPRRLHAFALHSTRSSRATRVEGLTAAGRRLLGDATILDGIIGRTLPGVALYGFPDDRSTSLVANNSHEWAIPAIGVIERQGERYLGARLANIGGNGGEPRENLDDAWNRPWTHDPGFLNRTWAGLHSIVARLTAWLGEARVSGGIEMIAVAPAGEAVHCRVHVVNHTHQHLINLRLELVDGDGDRVHTWQNVHLQVGERQSLEVDDLLRSAGIHRFSLRVANVSPCLAAASAELTADPTPEEDGVGAATIARATLYVLAEHTPNEAGFGFSTFLPMQNPLINREYATFCRLLRERGARYLRAALPWEDLEPEPEQYDFRIADSLLDLSRALDMPVLFWHFDTTRGSGLGSGGIPRWLLREPAIDRDGRKGYFPTLWSPFYRQRYFALIEKMAQRYATEPSLRSFVLDFGNSDFPYGYDIYGGDNTRWDYAPQERTAFAAYLRDQRKLDLTAVARLYRLAVADWDDIPVPFVEQIDAWRIYLDYRAWSIHDGIETAVAICRKYAPNKVANDLPGHGTGSIADLSTLCLSLSKQHWQEQQKHPRELVDLHNAGPIFGGEPWQVGGGWKEYDDALFMSLISGADYLTIPGPDLGGDTEALARVGYVRLSIQGAQRQQPRVAVMDRMEWNRPDSWANIAMRSDTPVDLLCRQHRFDLACYDLLVLPADELHGGTSTAQTGGCLLPTDEAWYLNLRRAVENGLTVVIFPRTAQPERSRLDLGHLRRVLGIGDVTYGTATDGTLIWPANYGSGQSNGLLQEVRGHGDVILRSACDRTVLLRRTLGKGAILLAGWDQLPESLDGSRNYRTQTHLLDHSLVRLFRQGGYSGRDVLSNEVNVYKCLLTRDKQAFLLIYGHLEQPIQMEVRFRAQTHSGWARDLATGVRHAIETIDAEWCLWRGALLPRAGMYLAVE